jgi:hypothetical protein
MMRPRPHTRPALSGRRLGLATVTAVVVAALAPTSAFAALDDLTNLTDVDATVENVTSTVSELSAPVAEPANTPKAAPATQAPTTSQPSPTQQVTSSLAPIAEAATPLTKPLETATAPITTTVQTTTAPVTPPIERATAPRVQTVSQTAQPVVQTVAPVVQTVSQTAQPVVSTVQQVTPVLATVTQTTTPVLATVDQVVAPVVAAVSPLVEQTAQMAAQVIEPILDEAGRVLEPVARTTEHAAAPMISRGPQQRAPHLGHVQETTTPSDEPGPVGGPTPESGVVGPARATPSPAVTSSTAPIIGSHVFTLPQRLPAATRQAVVRPIATVVPRDVLDSSSSSPHTTASQTPAPGPFAPGRPFGFFATAATGGASFFVPLFAVVAAIFLLAAQGVGRRLRPTLAPPQLPILALSLERPG